MGEALLQPTKIYVRTVKKLLCRGIDIRAISHITGGGLYENVPRMMKEGLTAQIHTSNVPIPPIFPLSPRRGTSPSGTCTTPSTWAWA